MNKLYRFSPITDEVRFNVAINYVLSETQKLCKEIIGKNLEFSGYLTIFSHNYDEFENLKRILLKIGKFESEHNSLYALLNKPIKTKYGEILRLRVRQPDPYRCQVGYGDFTVADYELFKKENLKKCAPYLREIVRPDMTMLEFWHPDFDVLAYIVKEKFK
jgi:hypothetical protein